MRCSQVLHILSGTRRLIYYTFSNFFVRVHGKTCTRNGLTVCVMYGIRQCKRIFFYCGEISAFFVKIFFYYFSCDIKFKFTLPNIQI